MKYKIALHRSDEGYSVSAPGLPGCWSQGETEAEALANIEIAIQEYLSVGMRFNRLTGSEAAATSWRLGAQRGTPKHHASK